MDTVVLDKTGTVTQGRPQVTEICPAPGVEKKELLLLAAAVEQRSDHPLALAILEGAKGLDWPQTEQFTTEEGKGVSAVVGGWRIFAGNSRMLREIGVSAGSLEAKADALARKGSTPLFFAERAACSALLPWRTS